MSDQRSTRHGAPLLGLLVGFALLGGLLVGAMVGLFRQQDASEWVKHTLEVQNHLARTTSLLQDLEGGARGFLLTGDPTYMAPSRAARAALPDELNILATLTADNPTQVQSLRTLREVIERRVSAMSGTLDIAAPVDTAPIVESMRRGQGRRQMEEARAIIMGMMAEEAALLETRERTFRDEVRTTQFVGLAAALGLLALAVYAVSVARAQVARIERANDGLRTTNAELQAQVALRERAETQLHQSQKMEAIGQLTGGVAHDFNNMLAIIVGSLSLLERKLARGEANLGKYLDAALDGARRASLLTKQLLAFARRQPLVPETLDANKLVSGISEMLRRTLGENISFETVVAGGLWPIRVDRSQLESALVNLAVNARDAMPGGGTLTIETANAFLDEAYAALHPEVHSGQYVMMSVTDTGHGMSPDVVAKAFEPFFTTKPSGAGTGLGLSQVYGFVKQSLGHIKIYSEPLKGTSIKIYLPRHVGEAALETVNAAPQRSLVAREGESVLVVEDEVRVRETLVESLRDLGYTVVHASDATAAIRKFEEGLRVTLLFTDIIMPGRTGRELADEVVKRWPGTKVLYTTGYSRNAIVHNGVLDPGVQVLTKPYTIEQVAAKVRDVIDA